MATVYNSLSSGDGMRVERPKANLPQSAAAPIFTISGGNVIIYSIIGEVDTTAIQAQANNMKLISNPTTGADVDLCAVLDIDGDAVGTMYHITGTLADALIATTSGAFGLQNDPIIVAPGTIDLSCSASNTGKIKWTVFYSSEDSGAKIVKA
jgi:hypothetical protein